MPSTSAANCDGVNRMTQLLIGGHLKAPCSSRFQNRISLDSSNIVIHSIFALYAAGSTLLLANMIEYGPARSYPRGACPAAGY
jgi:hypothetical protein